MKNDFCPGISYQTYVYHGDKLVSSSNYCYLSFAIEAVNSVLRVISSEPQLYADYRVELKVLEEGVSA